MWYQRTPAHLFSKCTSARWPSGRRENVIEERGVGGVGGWGTNVRMSWNSCVKAIVCFGKKKWYFIYSFIPRSHMYLYLFTYCLLSPAKFFDLALLRQITHCYEISRNYFPHRPCSHHKPMLFLLYIKAFIATLGNFWGAFWIRVSLVSMECNSQRARWRCTTWFPSFSQLWLIWLLLYGEK